MLADARMDFGVEKSDKKKGVPSEGRESREESIYRINCEVARNLSSLPISHFVKRSKEILFEANQRRKNFFDSGGGQSRDHIVREIREALIPLLEELRFLEVRKNGLRKEPQLKASSLGISEIIRNFFRERSLIKLTEIEQKYSVFASEIGNMLFGILDQRGGSYDPFEVDFRKVNEELGIIEIQKQKLNALRNAILIGINALKKIEALCSAGDLEITSEFGISMIEEQMPQLERMYHEIAILSERDEDSHFNGHQFKSFEEIKSWLYNILEIIDGQIEALLSREKKLEIDKKWAIVFPSALRLSRLDRSKI